MNLRNSKSASGIGRRTGHCQMRVWTLLALAALAQHAYGEPAGSPRNGRARVEAPGAYAIDMNEVENCFNQQSGEAR
jgi:hypothetical protein